MDYSLLKEIIGYTETFKKEHSSNKIEDFTVWLNSQLFSDNKKEGHSAHDELLIAFKLLYLNKELKKQTKIVLSESNLSSVDEYSFLLHLNHQDSFRKMEIIEMHNLEAPTGIEIIKRLLKNKFVDEFADREDKRAKRIKISKKGLDVLNTVKPKIDRIFTKFTEPLNLNEKILLSGILDKIAGF